MIVAACLALGCVFVVLGLLLGSAGGGLRRLGVALLALPIVVSLFVGALVSIVKSKGPIWGVVDVVLVAIVFSVAAYLILQLRSRLSSKRDAFRLKEKRPVDGRGGEPKLLSLLRDSLRQDDEP
jgi:hypothetical protein